MGFFIRRLAAAACALALWAGQAHADGLVQVPTRGDQSISYWWMPTEGATATVLLLSGGNGGIGMREGQPRSDNFLIRSRDLFRAESFNVALLGNPSDKRAMDDAWRTSEMHRADVAAVKKFWVVEGGENPSGNPCEALHWHGFIGMQARAVRDVSGWIRQSSP